MARAMALDESRLTPRAIFDRLGVHVIGQERARRAVAIAAYNHTKRIEQRREGAATLLRKSNLLFIGPTGCGKTHIARQLAEVLSVPFAVADATEYTEAGYYGKDVEVMVAELLIRAGNDVQAAERGIVFVDEIDKIARRTQGGLTGAGTRDIGGEGVQQALLKMLEGREVFVPVNPTQNVTRHDFVRVDTTDILFVCAGTFSDLQRPGARPLGFGSSPASERLAPLGQRQLCAYGMLPELLGRLPVVVELDELSEGELYAVLTAPPDSLVREYTELLAHDGVELRFTEGALRAVTSYAWEKRLGARGLRSILEEVMAGPMFHAPERRGQRMSIDARHVNRELAALEAEGRAF